ncbi:MAG: c-type cytochrome [Myxococcaceae bacterium]
MKMLGHEIIAGLCTLGVLVGVPYGFSRERAVRPEDQGLRIIALTAVKKDGAWTDEVVDGTNYWRKTFVPATITLRQGEEVLLRLASADVRHGFSAPELGIAPVEIDPGQIVEVRLRGERVGEFTYYCTVVCGRCHHGMRGIIRVLPAGAPLDAVAGAPPCTHDLTPPPAGATLVERGAFLFADKGCANCHGKGGSGGVSNFNYLAGTVPQNNLLAEKMRLFEPEDAKAAIDLLERRADLDGLQGAPPFQSYPQFLAQYHAVHDLILNGNRSGKKDPQGPPPPLNMPSWRHQVSEEDVNALIAYLLSQYPWEDE